MSNIRCGETMVVMPAYFIVKNLRGTSRRKCACGAWLEHWYNNTKRPSGRVICAAYRCGNRARVGAHVMEITGKRRGDWQHYIVPFCHPCNMLPPDEDIELKIGIELISANAQLMGCHRAW